MFIQQAFKAKHEWWRYLIGLMLIFIGWQVIGVIPLVSFAFLEAGDVATFIAAAKDNFMGMGMNLNLLLFLLMLTFSVGLVTLLLVVKFLHQQPIKEITTTRRSVDWGRIFFGFGLVSVYAIVFTLLDYKFNPEDYILNFKMFPFLIMLGIAVVMIPLQTSFEEYLFRGYLMQGIGVWARNKWLPLLITSFIFGGLHIFNPEVAKLGYIIMIYYIGTGLLFGIMTLMDEGMELALGFHAGNNLVIALLVTADWTAFQTHSILKDISEPGTGMELIAPVFLVYPVFLFIMAKKYKWSNWKEKLSGKVVPPVNNPEEDTNSTSF